MKYESFVLFANFWLGFNSTAKFTDKQRRSLIELEYSIICDEVMQAFQVGIDSQKIGSRDVHDLLKAVFKEYPLQLLSFRGTYMVLDFVDVLSSDRQDAYKALLSDVKCRTVNKQYAQWLLSIRSFALINMCYSIIKFYKKSVGSEVKQQSVLTSRNPKGNSILLDELDGRLSSLSMSINKPILNSSNNQSEKNDASSSSCSSSASVSSSSLSSTSISPSLLNGIRKSRPLKSARKQEETFSVIDNNLKCGFYLKAVFK